MACNNQYIVQDCCDSSNSFRVGDICMTGLTNGDIFYTECSGLTTGSTSFTFSGCVVVNSSSPILANAADTFSALTSYTACTDCQTAISGTPCPTPTPTVTPTTTNTSGLIYLTGQMSLPATLTVGMIVTDSSGNCWEIIATTGTTPNLTWGNQIFPVGGCASCLVVNPCPTLTPTVTPTNTPTNTVTPTVTPTSLGCQAYNIQVNTGISGCTFTYTDCSGATQTVTITSGMSNTVCALLPPTTSCGASAYTITNIGNCCQSYQIQVGSGVSGCTFSYVDCSGVTQNVTITSGNTNILCSLTVPTTSCGTSAYTMTNQGFCCQTYNINVNSTTTGCTFSYINCSGFNQTVTVLSGLPLSVCSIITPTTNCPASAYTMTMSGSCCSYYNLSVVDSSCTFNYIDCSGNSQSVVVTSTGSTNVCSLVTPTTSCNPTGYTITSASTCNPCITYTLTNNNLSPYTFNYTDCSGVTQSITLSGTGGNGVICTISPPPVISGVTVVASGNCNPSTCYYVSVQAGATYECYIDYDDPISGFTTLVIPSATTVNVCSTSLPVVSAISAVCSPSDVVIIAGSACTYNVDSLGYSWDCPTVPCKCWDVYIDPPTICTYPYVDCDGNIAFETITGGTTGLTICSPYQPDLTSCGATYTATTSGDCAIAISGVYECVPCTTECLTLGYDELSGTIQYYNLTANTSTVIATSVIVDDIASTSSYIWGFAGTNIYEYPWDSCPISFSAASRTITITGFTGSVLGSTSIGVNNNQLICSDDGSNNIYELDITTTTAIQTLILSAPVGREFVNDISYSATDKLLTITSGASGYYITQFDYNTAVQEVDVLWSAGTIPYSFISESTNLYVVDNLGDIYQIQTTTPYTQTFVQTPSSPFKYTAQYSRICFLNNLT